MRIINQTRNTTLITNARVANTFWLRLRGLLGSTPLKTGEGLVLVGVKSIHTLFMTFSIDIVYVDKNYSVIELAEDMVPYRLGSYVSQCAYVLEMPVGTIADTVTTIGDQLQFEQ
ncbi:DUF192 domain-containing protein [Anaerolineales bacterium HSG6]|nr:DUF192 domain-containing protein [Anaerolineales bacterium HSG6]MDM8530366.1 DUF192 domain-containing protein [Anaerolineales bacterium HSG25]